MQHLISMADAKGEINNIIDLALKLKNNEINPKQLPEKTLGMIFEKSSTRTRVSFEVGMYQLGGKGLYLSSNDLQLGRGESIPDTARVLSRFLDCVMIRAKKHEDVLEFVKYGSIPVISGLTDKEHPCQIFADLLTIKEYKNNFDQQKLVFIGDGNNVCNSLLLASAYVGMDMMVCCPKGYEPDKEIFDLAVSEAKSTGATIQIDNNVNSAIKNADIVYTDVWVSMGDEEEKKEREIVFKPYQINKDLLNKANSDAMVMHCLPAIRDQEITDEVMNSNQSAIWDQAENRLHAQKAILCTILKK